MKQVEAITALVDGSYHHTARPGKVRAVVGGVLLDTDTGADVATFAYQLHGPGLHDNTVCEYEAVFAAIEEALPFAPESLLVVTDRLDLPDILLGPITRAPWKWLEARWDLEDLTASLARFALEYRPRVALSRAHYACILGRHPLAPHREIAPWWQGMTWATKQGKKAAKAEAEAGVILDAIGLPRQTEPVNSENCCPEWAKYHPPPKGNAAPPALAVPAKKPKAKPPVQPRPKNKLGPLKQRLGAFWPEPVRLLPAPKGKLDIHREAGYHTVNKCGCNID